MSGHDEPADVGVGPWQGPWPDGDHFAPDLLRGGDRRNVADRYRYWTMDAVVADLDTRRHPFHVPIEHSRHDPNSRTLAFNAAAVQRVGKRRWNRRGAMVTDRYQHEHHHPDVDDLVRWASAAGTQADGIPIIGIDNLPGSVPLETYDLPRECVLVFGQEGPGLSEPMRAACTAVLHIEQFGSTRSINAGAAAAIAMHAWVRRHVFHQRPLPAGPPSE